MNCTLFSSNEGELREATSELPPHFDSESKMSSTTASVGRVLELGPAWEEIHTALGGHGDDHPLGFLVAGGRPVPSLQSGGDSGRCFMAAETVQLLAWVARLDGHRVRKLRQFLADAVLANHGVVVHLFR